MLIAHLKAKPKSRSAHTNNYNADWTFKTVCVCVYVHTSRWIHDVAGSPPLHHIVPVGVIVVGTVHLIVYPSTTAAAGNFGIWTFAMNKVKVIFMHTYKLTLLQCRSYTYMWNISNERRFVAIKSIYIEHAKGCSLNGYCLLYNMQTRTNVLLFRYEFHSIHPDKIWNSQYYTNTL